MNKLPAKLKLSLTRLFDFIPHPLPQNEQELTAFTTKICAVYKLPDVDFRQTVAMMVQHLDPTKDAAPLRYFGKSVRKAIANETAFHMIQTVKAEHKAKAEADAKAAELAKSAEAGQAIIDAQPVSN